MNVRQLIQQLASYDGETKILVAEDPEGNGFRTLVTSDLYFIEANEDKHGYVEDLYDAPDCDHEADEICTDFEPRVVLWP